MKRFDNQFNILHVKLFITRREARNDLFEVLMNVVVLLVLLLYQLN
jgi:hypothetical protein